MTDDIQEGSDRQKLLESLWQDAKREAEAEETQARLQADNLVEEARRSAEENLARALDRVRFNVEPQVARILNSAREEVRRALLVGLYAFLDECLLEAHNIIRNDRTGRVQREALPALLAESLSDLPRDGKVAVKVHPKDVPSTRKLLAEKGVTAEIQADESILGGVAVIINGGSERRDNTLSARLKVLGEAPPLEILSLLNTEEDQNASGDSPSREAPSGGADT